MSVEAIAIALHHSAAAGTTRLVLVGIANHDGDGGAWPAVRTLAKYTGKSERTVQRALDELVSLGELAVHYQAGGDADTREDRRPNLYELLLNCPPDCDGSKHHRLPGEPGYGVTRMSPRGRRRGDARVANGVTQVSPEPSLEPETPQPPQAGEPSCTRHRAAPGACCRACGTTPRQVEARRAREAAEQRRLDDATALEAARAAREASPAPGLIRKLLADHGLRPAEPAIVDPTSDTTPGERMNAPDLADEAQLADHGACAICGAPRRPSMSPELVRPQRRGRGGWILVCSADVDHDAVSEPTA